MESLIQQTRSRLRSSSSSTTDRIIPPQKEKKKGQGWIKKQLSRQMSWEYDFSSSEYPTAVAAAAYAIHIQSLEESNARGKKERAYGPQKSLRKTKSRAGEQEEETSEPLKSALKSSDGTPRAGSKEEGSTSKRLSDRKQTRKISFSDLNEVFSHNNGEKLPVPEAPPLQRAPSFPDRQSSMALPKPARPTMKSPPPPPPPPPPPLVHSTALISRRPGPADSAAAAWEKEQMASINERHEKLRETIDNWETKKKTKAKRKIEGIEVTNSQAELDKSKAKAIKKYNSEMARIAEIAGGARTQAEENRRKEELKVKDKANKIRATGKMPKTCLCF